jgi:hypothetical protein
LYIKVSGNSLANVIAPRHSDWVLYRRLVHMAWQWMRQQASLALWSR